jgi:hypothetical protein
MKLATPREFFRTFVEPAVADWSPNRVDQRRAIQLLCELDNLAEWMVLAENPACTRQQMSDARKVLRQKHDFLGVIQDVHDSHKHWRLSRSNAVVREARLPGRAEVNYGGAVGSMPIGAAPVGGSANKTTLIVEADGREYDLDFLVPNALQYWDAQMRRIGV